jgi:hypothetical protein
MVHQVVDLRWIVRLLPGNAAGKLSVEQFYSALRSQALAPPRAVHGLLRHLSVLDTTDGEQARRDPGRAAREGNGLRSSWGLDKRLRVDLRRCGDFPRVQPMPGASADEPDELDARLVVLGVDHPTSRRRPARHRRPCGRS